jgi:SpoVK/Ycf46/Vps4 family AAA+-type ATPase
VLDGNIFDQVLYGLKTFTLREFLKELMPEHDYVLRYNTVEGATGEKGDKAEMGKWLGFDQDGLNREQLVKLLSDGGQMNNPDRLFEKLSRALLKKDKRLVMIFDFAEFIFSGNELYSLQARVWALKEEFRKNGHVIIMLTHVNDDIDRRIHNNQLGVRFLTIPKPNTETRTTYLRSLEPESLRGEDARTVALLTSGLGLRQIDALLRSVEDQNLLEHIKKDKFELVAQEYGQLFRAVPCGTGLDVIGGSEKVKKQLRAVARWLKEGKLAKLPMGIMFDGPPGTGKTFTAINWAGELDGFSMIMPLDIRDSFVGQSEKNMTRMIRGARDLAPCVVFWDEADQEGSRGGRQADGGTDSRVFRRRLEWMGDTADRGQIIHVIATNRSDLLDAAMARTGRSDLRLAFLEPNQAERELLIKTICVNHTKNYGIQYEELEVEELARLADGRSQADLDKILRMADEIADENGRSAVTQSDVAAAIYNFRTNTKYQDEKDLATLQAIDGVSDRRMLPDGWQDQVTRIYKRLEDIQIPRVREFATRLYREVQKEESELQVATETGDGRGNGHANDTKTDEVYIEGRHLEL